MTNGASIWEPHLFEEGDCINFNIGPLHVWIMSSQKEWHIAHEHNDDDEGQLENRFTKCDQIPDHLEIARWIAQPTINELKLIPILPDRPLVAQTDFALHIPKSQQVDVFLHLPLWIRMEVGRGKETIILGEIPTVLNSSTWFGDPVAGELCYTLKTVASTSLQVEGVAAHRVVTTVTIENKSDGDLLKFEKICVRAPKLNIYGHADRFWTNDVHMLYRGSVYGEDINYSDAPPNLSKKADLISKHRVVNNNLIKSGLSDIKSWVYG